MAIEFQCGHCKRTLKLKDKCAGLTGECPYCKGVLTIPKAAPPPAVEKKPDHIAPTEKQLDYARSLGISIPEGISRSKLSELIDDAKDNLPATEKQKEFLRDLGVSFSDDIRRNQISMLIDAALDLQQQMTENIPKRIEEQMREAGMLIDSATDDQLLQELDERGKLFFAFIMDNDEFRYQDMPMKGRLLWNDSLNIEDVKYLIASIAIEWAKDLDMNEYSDNFDGQPPVVEFSVEELETEGNVVHLNPFSLDTDN